MNGLFGSGRMAPGTGIVLAAADRGNSGPGSPVILANENTGELYFAAATGSGASGVSALSTVMLEAVAAERPLTEAMARGRLQASLPNGTVLVESGLSAGERAALTAQGLQAVPVDRLGRVNALHCPRGLRRDPDECEVASDRRGWGLAQRVQ
jgi:gamma-glutamyltranspeptidase/glutathione hydrolase